MSTATVFLFLLDNLPDFQNSLNSTLATLLDKEDLSFEFSILNECNPTVAQSVLNDIKNNVEEEKVSHENVTDAIKHDDFKEIFDELSPETLYNIGTVYDNSVEDSENLDSYESKKSNKTSKIRPDYPKYYKDQEGDDFDMDNAIDSDIFDRKVKLPESVPSMVAMFETLSNVTAQTCGGTLLSPRWVITTATCLDLLSSNGSKNHNSSKSEYTIVAGANNPLNDGTIHHVTDMILFPKETLVTNSTLDNLKSTKTVGTHVGNITLALLRITPPAHIQTFPISHVPSKGEEDVLLYGWIQVKEASGKEVMKATSISAKTMRSEQCGANLSDVYHESMLCLNPKKKTRKDVESKIKQMHSGGPVLAARNNKPMLLAVAQFELPSPQAPLFAHPLAAHATWINAVIAYK